MDGDIVRTDPALQLHGTAIARAYPESSRAPLPADEGKAHRAPGRCDLRTPEGPDGPPHDGLSAEVARARAGPVTEPRNASWEPRPIGPTSLLVTTCGPRGRTETAMNTFTHPFLTLPGLPESGRPLLWTLLTEPLVPLPALRSIVASYSRVIEGLGRRGQRVNVPLGKAIALALDTILLRVDERTGDGDYRVIQAAVRYFVIENDGGSDFASNDGLLDDARVVNAMLRWLGRDDLIIDLALRPPRSSGVFGGAARVHDRR
ncbi:MAG: hypothetical protein U1F43_27005 [Myxococcota bacterium]